MNIITVFAISIDMDRNVDQVEGYVLSEIEAKKICKNNSYRKYKAEYALCDDVGTCFVLKGVSPITKYIEWR